MIFIYKYGTIISLTEYLHRGKVTYKQAYFQQLLPTGRLYYITYKQLVYVLFMQKMTLYRTNQKLKILNFVLKNLNRCGTFLVI